MATKIATGINLILGLAILALIGHYLGIAPWSGTKLTLDDIQIEYLAGIITSDCTVQGEDPEVCLEVGRSALRLSATYGVSPKQIFKDGLSLIPPGTSRSGPYLRWISVVKSEADDWGAVLAAARGLAEEAKKNGSPSGCATHYIRASRRTDRWAQPGWAKEQMRKQMHSVGRFEGKGFTEFFCRS